jgi:tripartite-type tricarboxylate transporter receptor subunit TctC
MRHRPALSLCLVLILAVVALVGACTQPSPTAAPTVAPGAGQTPQPSPTPVAAEPTPTPTPAGPPFYQGRTIRVIVGFSPGGGFDAYARMLARHLPRHIPGEPRAVVQNMPGGGGLSAANYRYRAAPADGTVMATTIGTAYLSQFLGEAGVEFDSQEFAHLGSLFSANQLIIARTEYAGERSLDELAQAINDGTLRTFFLGSPGAGPTYQHGRILEELVGYPAEWILGYPGSAEANLAIRRGEVDGGGAFADTVLSEFSDLLAAGEIRVLSQTGGPDLQRDPQFPDVPALMERAQTQLERALVSTYLGTNVMNRWFFMPPNVPGERVSILTQAIQSMVQDSDFLAEAEATRRPIHYVLPSTIEGILEDIFTTPPEEAEFIRDVLAGR